MTKLTSKNDVHHLIFSEILSTGGSTSLNNSYIEVSSSTSLSVGMTEYTICPCSDDICRIKFDFEVSKNGIFFNFILSILNVIN